MGSLDTEGKQYLSDNTIFADAFNYLLSSIPVVLGVQGT